MAFEKKSERRQVLATPSEWKRFDKWASSNNFKGQSEAIRAAIIMISSSDKIARGKPITNLDGTINYSKTYNSLISVIKDSLDSGSTIFVLTEDLYKSSPDYDKEYKINKNIFEVFYSVNSQVKKIENECGCSSINHGYEYTSYGEGEIPVPSSKGFIFFRSGDE